MSQRRVLVLAAVVLLGVAQLIFFWVVLDGCTRWLTLLFVPVAFAMAVAAIRSARSGRRNLARQKLLGLEGEVIRALDPVGTVEIRSELWSAESVSGEPIPEGETVVVRDKVGPLLRVEVEARGAMS